MATRRSTVYRNYGRFTPRWNAQVQREGHGPLRREAKADRIVEGIVCLLRKLNSRAVANPRSDFASAVQGGANTIIRRGHPQALAEVRPAVGVIVLAAARAERVHHQKWPAVLNTWRVVFTVAGDEIRRGEIA